MGLDIGRVLRDSFIRRVENHAELGSTNDRARQCAAEVDAPLPLLIVADEQAAGRGRGSNRWWTGRGGLAMSALVQLPQDQPDASDSPLVALAAAVAVVEAVSPRLVGRRVGIHWPNDVYAEGRKLAGILVELMPGGLAIVGVGLNANNTLAEAPPELRETAATLRDLTGEPHDPTALIAALLRRLDRGLRTWAKDPTDIGRRANLLCLQRGRVLAVQCGPQTIEGECLGIAPDGALVLSDGGGQRRVYSGIVLP